ncbi:MAG: FlgD immunoglobulin-like domain containing protein [Candidatus Delongbacteria bacterium]
MLKSVVLGLLLLAAGARADVLHQEQFSEGTADLSWFSSWGESADQVAVDWMTGNPSADGFIGTLGNGLSGGGVGTALVDAPDLTDYQLSAQVYLVPGTTHYRGIVGRATEFTTDTTSTWGFYAFVADLSEGTGMGDERLMLRKWLPGGTAMTTIKVWTRAELGDLYPATEGWYNLGMAFAGSQITCSLNGQTLPDGTRSDDAFTGGGFGVYYFDFADMDGHLSFDDVLVEGETRVDRPVTPAGLALGNPWPNPFNPSVRVPVQLERAARLTARVYDLGGRLVSTLADGQWAAGLHELHWNGQDAAGRPAASGLYLLRVESAGTTRETRLTLLR